MNRDLPFVEYLYGSGERYRIVKRTKQRVYYAKRGEPIDERGEPIDDGIISYTDSSNNEIGFLDRQKLEAVGYGHSHYCRYYASLEGWLAKRRRFHRGMEQPDLAALKAAMAAAHPDKGGSSAAFIEARQRYVAARRACRFQPHE